MDSAETPFPSDSLTAGSADEAYRLFNDLPFIGVAVSSATTRRWVKVNDALCEMLRYPREVLITKTWLELTHPDDVADDAKRFEQLVRGDVDGYRREKRYLRSDGEEVHAIIDVKAVRAPGGHAEFVVATIANITERVLAEAAERRSAALLANLGKQVPGVIYQFLRRADGTSSFPFASDGIREIYEVSPDEVRQDATPVFARLHADDLAMVSESIAHSERTLEPWRCDYRVMLPSRGLRWLRGDARPERLPDGSTLWHGFITDSTDRQLEREALVESEARFRIQIEHAPEAIVVYDADARQIIDANSNALRLFGYTREEVLGRSIRDLAAERQADGRATSEIGAQFIERALAGEVPVFEWLHRHSSGRSIPCEVRLVRLPAHGRNLVRGSVTDITERLRAAEALTRLEAAITSSINGVAMADLDGRITYVNKALLDLWGYDSPDGVLGTDVARYWASPDEVTHAVAVLRATGAWTSEMTAIRADGTVRLFQVNASLFPDISGQPIGMLASFADITEKRRTEEALHLRDEAIRTAITAIAIGDPHGTPLYVNPAFVRLWGFENEAAVLGRQITEFLATGGALPTPRLERVIADGVWQGELTARRADGTLFDILVAANVVRNDAGVITYLMGSFLDITESKRMQTQFLQAQKMESVGRLAGGVAHDFNNLLTVMKGCLDLALAAVPREGDVHSELLEASRAADSAAELTRQLLAFSRKQIIAPRVLDLNDVVQRVQGMLLRVLGSDVRLQVLTAPSLGAVRFDPGQAEQILLNLAVNARDAMPDGGLLTLETSNVTLDDDYTRTHPDTPSGDYVLLTVSDTGLGMNEETRAHVFEPFFTTKGVGKGTGLGLAMIHGAVSQNGGRVEVYSEVGHGTSFKIFLPRVPDAVAPSTQARVPLALPSGTETVLLVEDDDSVRLLIFRLLVRQGYRVHSFSGGPALLEWLQDNSDPIHLLITDVIMPGMNGKVLAEKVRAIRPETRVLYASGYTANVIVQHGVLKPGVEFLSKPFTAASLALTVRELLDRV